MHRNASRSMYSFSNTYTASMRASDMCRRTHHVYMEHFISYSRIRHDANQNIQRERKRERDEPRQRQRSPSHRRNRGGFLTLQRVYHDLLLPILILPHHITREQERSTIRSETHTAPKKSKSNSFSSASSSCTCTQRASPKRYFLIGIHHT